ncbi:hypothetical protein [Actinomadura atramentaria]|uniref:hypothetical protein n=1 Tax=Actinomadura atramentaria TaxID=1990 RepID=UPI000A030956|nr:hypothetical protein [Actinomadura atramentaria]
MPVNQRVVFLEALGLTLRETYPGVSCRVARFRAALPPVLGVYFGDARREIGCDLAHDGWNFVWGFDPRRVIGPAGDLSRAAAAIAADLGAHPRPGH